MKMKYCKRCVQPDTRPGVEFIGGVCGACIYEENKTKIDWEKRHQELVDIAERAKESAEKKGSFYDCVIGVSGGKDSTFISLYCRDKLGLKPLLVNSTPDDITEVGRKNMENLTKKGFDVVSLRPNPVIAKKMARNSFFEKGNIVTASEYALFASELIIADRFDIPLIVQGENDALVLGTTGNQVENADAFGISAGNTLGGFDSSVLVDENNGIELKDLFLYTQPSVEKMKSKGIRAIYLQYYLKEWSQVGNADFSVARGLIGRNEDLHDLGRYRRFSALDSDINIVNQMLKYYKFGFGFATDEACYDVREGRITRDEAIWLVNEYDGKCGERFIDIVCDYLEISKRQFWDTVDHFVNKSLFYKNNDGNWCPKFIVGHDFDDEA